MRTRGTRTGQGQGTERSGRTARSRIAGVALVLILVLIVIAMLSLGAYSFTDLMLAHHEAAISPAGRCRPGRWSIRASKRSACFCCRPKQSARSRRHVRQSRSLPRRHGRARRRSQRPRQLQRDLPRTSTTTGNLDGMRHGLEDESTRLNLNTLLIARQAIARRRPHAADGPAGMTEDVADAILDWLDADDEPRELGCEIEYYSGLSPAYAPKNGPLDTVEELLLVRGVTPQLLFGADINRNGQLDRARDGRRRQRRLDRPDRVSRLVGLSHALQPGVEHQARRPAADLSQHQRSEQAERGAGRRFSRGVGHVHHRLSPGRARTRGSGAHDDGRIAGTDGRVEHGPASRRRRSARCST